MHEQVGTHFMDTSSLTGKLSTHLQLTQHP